MLMIMMGCYDDDNDDKHRYVIHCMNHYLHLMYESLSPSNVLLGIENNNKRKKSSRIIFIIIISGSSRNNNIKHGII